jgi:hypothetical protein
LNSFWDINADVAKEAKPKAFSLMELNEHGNVDYFGVLTALLSELHMTIASGCPYIPSN